MTRVLDSDMAALSQFLKTNFSYDTGRVGTTSRRGNAWQAVDVEGRLQRERRKQDHVRYNQLTSSTDVFQSGFELARFAEPLPTNTTQFLSFANTNYQIVENRSRASANGTRRGAR